VSLALDRRPATEALLADLAEVRRDRGRGAESFRLEVQSFHISAGECVAIVGPSGSGKSTFLDLLALSLAPSAAARRFRMGPQGEDVDALWRARDERPLARLRREWIGYVLQSGALLPFLSAAQNVELPLRLAGRAAERARARELMMRLGIMECADRLPAELSIGQRQRVAVARALVHGPGLVLADEPTAALDAEAASAVIALLVQLATERGAAVLLVSHDERLAARNGFTTVPCRPVPAQPGRSLSVIRR
jgi:putative ABC transport system ATP-binding protein